MAKRVDREETEDLRPRRARETTDRDDRPGNFAPTAEIPAEVPLDDAPPTQKAPAITHTVEERIPARAPATLETPSVPEPPRTLETPMQPEAAAKPRKPRPAAKPSPPPRPSPPAPSNPSGEYAGPFKLAPKGERKSSFQRQAEERDVAARQLKNDGYNSSVTARKMIEVYGMTEAEAEVLVSRIYGKKVSARTGDTMSEVIMGLIIAAAGAIALGGMIYVIGFRFGFILTVYAALLGVIGKGLTKAVIAIINVNAKEEIRNKDVPDP